MLRACERFAPSRRRIAMAGRTGALLQSLLLVGSLVAALFALHTTPALVEAHNVPVSLIENHGPVATQLMEAALVAYAYVSYFSACTLALGTLRTEPALLGAVWR